MLQQTDKLFLQHLEIFLPTHQKLLLGSCVDKTFKSTDVIFGIKKINHSYYDWTGNPFEDYEIDILQGTKEDVYSYLTNHKCFIGCEECCGCGDW